MTGATLASSADRPEHPASARTSFPWPILTWPLGQHPDRAAQEGVAPRPHHAAGVKLEGSSPDGACLGQQGALEGRSMARTPTDGPFSGSPREATTLAEPFWNCESS